MISATVITLNEEARIEECLRSLAWVDEVIVVDSGSTDRTRDLAEALGARVFQRPWSGYADQRNFAIEQCRGEWILYLDADERLSHGFEAEARAIESASDSRMGYYVNSREYFMGGFLEHGGYGLRSANKKVRLWRNRKEHRFSGTVHERVSLADAAGQLRSYVEHYSTAATVSGMLDKLNTYTTLETRDERSARPIDLVVSPLKVFVSRYFKHQGFRDGVRGLVVCEINAFYKFVEIAKRLERRSQVGPTGASSNDATGGVE